MDASLEPLFNLYVFTTGRLLFGLAQVRAAALAQGFNELVNHCDIAIAHGHATRELERRWAGEPGNGGTNPEAQRIDTLVDGTLGAIRDHAVAQTRGADPGDPIHGLVVAFVKALFPVSVHAVTSLPYVDELAAVDDIVKLLNGELVAGVEQLGLGRLTKRLADLAEQYREALNVPPTTQVQWDHVRAARAEGQGLLLEAVAIIVGKHHQRTAEGTALRRELLGPILKQNEAIGQYLRARRAVRDVDPASGKDATDTPANTEAPQDSKENAVQAG